MKHANPLDEMDHLIRSHINIGKQWTTGLQRAPKKSFARPKTDPFMNTQWMMLSTQNLITKI